MVIIGLDAYGTTAYFTTANNIQLSLAGLLLVFGLYLGYIWALSYHEYALFICVYVGMLGCFWEKRAKSYYWCISGQRYLN